MKPSIFLADCRDLLAMLPDNSVDSGVTDPPYHLTSVVKRFGGKGAAPAKHGTDGLFARQSRGFMGQTWDGGDIAFRPELWAEVYRVLKPGAHLAAFSGTRTYHRMAVAIEDAGFEIRDQLAWVYGTGFPKSHNVSKAIDAVLGAERKVIGHQADGIASGTGRHAGTERAYGFRGEYAVTAPATDLAKQWQGYGTALKPAWEPICLARKPLSEPSVAANVLRWGTGAINVDGCRVGTEVLPEMRAGQARLGTFERADMVTPERIGRFPANVCHDGSPEVLQAFPSAPGQLAESIGGSHDGTVYNRPKRGAKGPPRGDSGSAARFFYCAKASKNDRGPGNNHPTVKPTALMQWLCRLITPPAGLVLDPFTGSGSTCVAAVREGFGFIGSEQSPDYHKIAVARMIDELVKVG